MDFGPTGKRGKNGRKMGKLAQKWVKNGHFTIFRPFFPLFPGGAKIHFLSIFGPEARFEVCTGQSGSQPYFSLNILQGKIPWLDSACADCPGFVVPGAAPAPPSLARPMFLATPWNPDIDNPRASYRAQDPTNPKIGPKNTSPTSEFPQRQEIEKIPRKYQKDTPQMRFSYFWGGGYLKYPENTRKIPQKYDFRIFRGIFSGGYLKGYFGGSHILYVGGSFCISWGFPIL